jgi:serine/threonine protein kinase
MFKNKIFNEGIPFDRLYSIGIKIGDGGFGSVFSGNRLIDNLQVAIKIIYKKKIKFIEKCNNNLLPLEISLLRKVQHIPGVIKLIDWHERMDAFCLVMETGDSLKDLFDFITDRKTLDEELAKTIFRQEVEIVYNLHKNGIVHRDLKSENILIDLNTFAVKIIDFGSAAYLKEDSYSNFEGTFLYAPPEWISRKKYYAESATIWSLGILLYEMVCGDIPFHAESLIISAHFTFKRNLSIECMDLIEKCLSLFTWDRPSFEGILSHPWLRANLDHQNSSGIDFDKPPI